MVPSFRYPLALSILLTCALVKPAAAIDRQCGANQFWNPAQGACVKKPARKLSADEKYHRAIEILEGKIPRTAASEAFAILDAGCASNHAASCEALGFLYSRGRAVAQDVAQGAIFYDRACALGSLDACVSAAELAQRNNHPDVARKNYGLACERGAGAACARAGEMAERGAGGSADASQAKQLYTQAFTLFSKLCPSDSNSCDELGLLYYNGRGIAADRSKAYQAWQQGCTAGSGDACNRQGKALELGIGIVADKNAAMAYFNKACEQYDNADACTTHGNRLAASGTDPVKGLAQSERGCVLDDSECGWAARMYARGIGAAEDQPKATTLFTKACERGSLDSCIDLGIRQRDGIGGNANRTAALASFDRACTGGNANGCTQAAQLLAPDDATSAKAFRYADMGCDRDDGQACLEAASLARRGRHGKAVDLERAFRLAQRGCKQENPAACAAVADAHEAGAGTSKDLDQAVTYFQKACEGNATQLKTSACVSLARILSAGEGVTKDPAAALTAAIRACEYKEETACEMIGTLADVAKPDDKVKAAALAALGAACDGKIESACVLKGYLLATGALSEKAPKQAYDLFTASCSRKYDNACNQQANALAGGLGVTMNREQAQNIWKDLCDRQYASACTSLAKLYRLDKRDNDAVPLWLQACDQKIGEACNSAALAHYSQRGTTWDVIAAGKLYKRACDYGFSLGCTNYGELYEYGIGVPADAKQAALYYDKGCTDTVPEGCGRIARMLVAGNGISKDLMRAEAMFRRGCTAGEPESCRELADLLESAPMPPRAEIARLRAAAYQGVTTQAKDNPYYLWVLGKFVRDGVGTVKDPKASTDWFAKACDGYDPMGCLAAGTAFASRDGGDNRDRAKLYFERACGAGVEAGCQRLAGKNPGQVSSKGCGGCGTDGGRSGSALVLPLLATLGMFGWLRRRFAATPPPSAK